MSDEITNLLRSIDPLREEELAAVLSRSRARGGASGITATQWPRPRGHARRALSIVGASAVVAAGGVAAAFSLSSSSTPSAEALSFSQRGDYVIARIVNPYASVSELKRELVANHLRVTLKLVPASPGSVGNVVMIDANGTPSSGIQPLLEGRCANGPCTVGVKVLRRYRGSGYVVIGRPAKPGERYESTPIGGSFAPGEALHCSGLEGATLRRALPVLRSKGLKVVQAWWTVSATGKPELAGLARPKAAVAPLIAAALMSNLANRRRPSLRLREISRIEDITPVAPGKVEVWVAAPSLRQNARMPHAARRPHAPAVAEASAMLKRLRPVLKPVRPFLRQSCRARWKLSHALSRSPAG